MNRRDELRKLDIGYHVTLFIIWKIAAYRLQERDPYAALKEIEDLATAALDNERIRRAEILLATSWQ